ncbi:hypothetical protein HKCCE4037_08530 [Rhodobacterales bacterium HKCCE4037]|nr:hypothetical protein [Rhodobacterales bacterium HKCCE4037]
MSVAAKPRVTREDSADLGFAWACLMSGAITLDEFKAWAEHVVTVMDAEDLPPHMIELMELDSRRDATLGLKDLTGFWPHDPFMDNSAHATALHGISALRGAFRAEDAGTTRAKAVALLSTHPQVAERFATVFPFLTLPEGAPA